MIRSLPGRSADVDLATGYRRVLLPNHAPRPGVGRFWGVASLAVFGELSTARYDAVVIQGWNYALYPLALLAARRAGLPVLMRAESARLPGAEPAATPRQLAKDAILRRYLGACAGALAVSSGNRRLLVHYGMPPARIFSSPYAVDGERFRRSPEQRQAAQAVLRARLGLPTGGPGDAAPPILLYCGKLVPVKEPQLLLAAFAALRRGGTPAALVVVGDGPLRGELQAWTRAHAVPDVHFLGFKNQSELPELYAAADALILPSRRETFGVVVIEALHAGVPVIASDGVGCAEDLVLDLYKQIPPTRITDLLLEVDAATGFTEAFTHLRTGAPCADRIGLMNVILAEGINLGLRKMADATNTHTFWELIRIGRWHVEGEAYDRALAMVVEAQAALPMARFWGMGTSASSDGQFFVATEQGEAMNLVNAKYGNTPGLKAYSHVSDQYAPFATQVIPATVSEAPYILDGLLMNDAGRRVRQAGGLHAGEVRRDAA